MRSVLLFFIWLTLCCSSLSANELTSHTQKDSQTNISKGLGINKKKKSISFVKIKLHSTKARLILVQSILPELPFCTQTKSNVSTEVQTITWRTFRQFNYQHIFSYLYPKHAFW